MKRRERGRSESEGGGGGYGVYTCIKWPVLLIQRYFVFFGFWVCMLCVWLGAGGCGVKM